MQPLSKDRLRDLLPLIDSPKFSPEVFDAAGVFIVRNAIRPETMAHWQAAWNRFYGEQLEAQRKVNKSNPVAVSEAAPPDLANIHQDSDILDVIEQAFGPDIALYNQRFVIKDQQSRGPVFLHSDYPYHFGYPRKASAFVPLGEVTPENGGLYFYLGTHAFGNLGDAGEINTDILDADWPVACPSVSPCDLVLMNSCTWHGSGPHIGGPDRIFVDIIYQPANDPSGVALLRGQWRTEVFLARRTDVFKRSRVSRLKELQAIADKYAPPGQADQT